MLLPASQLLNYFLHCAKFCFSQESYYFVELFLGRGGVQCSGICVYFLVVYLLEPSDNYSLQLLLLRSTRLQSLNNLARAWITDKFSRKELYKQKKYVNDIDKSRT